VRESHLVLVVTDDADFARNVIARWQMERTVPRITAIATDLFAGIVEDSFDLAIVGPVCQGLLPPLLSRIENGRPPVICVLETSAQIQTAKSEHPRALILQKQEGWIETLVLFARECLKRVDLTARLRHTEDSLAASSRHAALGRYMLESRHDFNNALTSVLGNAELLLMEGPSLVPGMRDQLETIREMALHLHRLMQRFSSLALEIRPSQTSSQDETKQPSHVAFSDA
jgi:signal transduction histidine kinase